MPIVQSRRRLLTNFALAGAASLGGLGAAGLGSGRASFAAEPPPEITTIRLERDPVICLAPQFTEELLRAEGFSDVRYVDPTEADDGLESIAHTITRGAADFARVFASNLIVAMDAGAPITIVTGLHLGCFEMFVNENIRSFADLRGRSVGTGFGDGDKPLAAIILRLLGLDPTRDVRWVRNTSASTSGMQLFLEGKVDAFLALPPEVYELRDRKIGQVLISSIKDRPWSQYFCCMLAGHTDFVHRYPVATKRVTRALLKAIDLCASDPRRVVQLLVDRGLAARYDYALQALTEIRYDVWRDYDPEDTIRFYALRLHEAGIIKSSPQKLIAKHTNWTFLNELKRELKA
jgi:NitT/TauT family transport system substrate-binding protein